MRFVDEATVIVTAGDGGNGVVAFLRERFRPHGGPCGGDGGRGGDVIMVADPNISTLLDFRSNRLVRAKRGQDGGGKHCHGKSATPVTLRVPVGTVIIDDDTGAVMGDLTKPTQQITVARGGNGGKGNARFATPTNRAPRIAEPGQQGEARRIRLELKLLADVGIVGLPNVGKSTLISHLSAARPKIADYPFTTLVPNLGVVDLGAGESFVMADIPGIVRGASTGAGLGHRFLRHVQRSATLLHLIGPTLETPGQYMSDFDALTDEIAAFDPELVNRSRVVALNKMDLPDVAAVEADLRRAFEKRGIEFFAISAVTGQGLDPLKQRLGNIVQIARNRAEKNDSSDPDDASTFVNEGEF
ncbi:MAG: GTPase ObgE [Myxococcota bacterium]|nr:GTPase ObgE [Myxococcota bacterium]